jgi:translation initiation factor 2B subunit (eIF-2B alpha/beta/delta family)
VGTLIAERVDELRRDTVHGAGWMAERALDTLVEEAGRAADDTDELLMRLHEAGRSLADSRRDAGAVAGAIGRALAAAFGQRHLSADEVRLVVTEEARAILDARHRAARAIAIQLAPRLTDADVMTHSASATVREAFVHTPPRKVTCTVSRPREEGRAFAEELREAGIDVELVEDDEAAASLDQVGLLLFGADTVFRDGTLCNKVGTLTLARAASERGVAVAVACEVLKLSPHDSAEARHLAEDGTRDFTPPHLIGEFVTEEGIIEPDQIAALIDRTPFLREGYELLRKGR